MVDFADNIYLWRIFRGLSQEQLAKNSNIPRPNISAIESGRREASLSTVRQLAASLGTTAGALVNGTLPAYLKGKGSHLSRASLEVIVETVLNKTKRRLTSDQEVLITMFSNIINNRLNARNKIYKNTLTRGRREYITSWLIFKSLLGASVANNLLSRLDKYIAIT